MTKSSGLAFRPQNSWTVRGADERRYRHCSLKSLWLLVTTFGIFLRASCSLFRLAAVNSLSLPEVRLRLTSPRRSDVRGAASGDSGGGKGIQISDRRHHLASVGPTFLSANEPKQNPNFALAPPPPSLYFIEDCRSLKTEIRPDGNLRSPRHPSSLRPPSRMPTMPQIARKCHKNPKNPPPIRQYPRMRTRIAQSPTSPKMPHNSAHAPQEKLPTPPHISFTSSRFQFLP